MPVCNDFSPIGIHTKKRVAWRFAAPGNSYLPAGVALQGPPTIVVTDKNNVDSNPQNIIQGSVVIGNYANDPTNTVILAQIANGVDGAYYLFDVYCPTTDDDQAEASNHVACIKAT